MCNFFGGFGAHDTIIIVRNPQNSIGFGAYYTTVKIRNPQTRIGNNKGPFSTYKRRKALGTGHLLTKSSHAKPDTTSGSKRF